MLDTRHTNQISPLRPGLHPTMSSAKTFLLMALFVLVGLPMVAYLWETINELLALKVDLVRIGISIPVLALLIGFLAIVGRRVNAWHSEPEKT